MELISVVMSVYREPAYMVQEALDSIEAQTYKNFELIVILYDPGNDSMRKFLEEYAESHPKVVLMINQKNIGLALSLNRGIDSANGAFIARMDADDRSLPDRLTRELDFLKNGHYDMVSSLVEKIDEDGNVWDRIPPFPNDSKVILGMLPVKNVVVHPTVLMRKSAVDNLEGYRNFASSQDYDLWLRMVTAGMKIGIVNEVLLQFRSRAGSISSSRRFNQYLNEKYIRQLYKERLVKGEDSFSQEALEEFLKQNHYYDKTYVESQNKKMFLFKEGKQELKSGHAFRGVEKLIRSMIESACVRDSLRITVASKINRRKYS